MSVFDFEWVSSSVLLAMAKKAVEGRGKDRALEACFAFLQAVWTPWASARARWSIPPRSHFWAGEERAS